MLKIYNKCVYSPQITYSEKSWYNMDKLDTDISWKCTLVGNNVCNNINLKQHKSSLVRKWINKIFLYRYSRSV